MKKQSSLSAWLGGYHQKPRTPNLPDPQQQQTVAEKQSFSSANKAVDEAVIAASVPFKRKRGDYHLYNAKTRYKIARYAEENGISKGARLLERELGHQISTSTVQSIRDAYRKRVAVINPDVVSQLPIGSRGRPLLLGEDIDKQVLSYIKALRESGGVVNRKIVIAAALGIVEASKPSLLLTHGGPLDFMRHSRSWSESFLRRAKLVKRKATKAARKLPEGFQQIRTSFHNEIEKVVREYNIPPEMVLNMDETGLRILPVDRYTLDYQGAKQVPVIGKDDKREITALLTCTMSGSLLPPQLLYQGKTERCHPQVKFPDGWDIYHSESHWSTGNTILRYIETVLKPWLTKCKSELHLPTSQKGLLLMDVFKAHRTPGVREMLEKADVLVKFIPAGCTGELQPLDVQVNSNFKSYLTDSFTKWYAERVSGALQATDNPSDLHEAVQSVRMDFKLSVIKPLHAGWVMDAFAAVQTKTDLIQSAWRLTGISVALATSTSVSQNCLSPSNDQFSSLVKNSSIYLSGSSRGQATRSTTPVVVNSVVSLSVERSPSPDIISSSSQVLLEGTSCYSSTSSTNPATSIVSLTAASSFSEYFLLPDICQSLVGGRRGSSACTVIAVVTGSNVLCGTLDLPSMWQPPSMDCRRVFTECMIQGNTLYDNYGEKGLLSIQSALQATVGILPVFLQREIFLSGVVGWQGVVEQLRHTARSNCCGTAAYLLVSTPYTILLAASRDGALTVFDSHSHGPTRGALVAVSNPAKSTASIANYLSGYFARHFGCSQSFRLSSGTVVSREYHFGVLQHQEQNQ